MKQYETSLKVYFGRQLWILDVQYEGSDILFARPTDSCQPLPDFLLEDEYFCNAVREALPRDPIAARNWGKEMIECGHKEKDFV